MTSKKIENYGLYQTLFSSKKTNEKLTEINRKQLLNKISKFNVEQERAFLMLIFEHARLKNEFEYDPKNINLPYSIQYDENNITLDFSKLPQELQLILWKFSNIIKNEDV